MPPPAAWRCALKSKPTKAAEAFANKNGISVDDLVTANDGKVDKLLFKKEAGGEASKDLLAGIVAQSLSDLPISKRIDASRRKCATGRTIGR